MTEKRSIIVVGAGIFGVVAAQELAKRGHTVAIFDPGPIPHPLASSTDITKMIRMDYGSDELYMDLMEDAFKGWGEWNVAWGQELYHEQGFLLMKKSEMADGSFELESFNRLSARGNELVRMNSDTLREKHPAWNHELYMDGYYNPQAGWAESGNVVNKIAQGLPALGVQVHDGKGFAHFLEKDSQVTGIVTTDGDEHPADYVVMAVGAWSTTYMPDLSDVMWTVGLPVMHFTPPDPEAFSAPHFVPFAADISESGWYGFPYHPITGVVKVANHGKGVPVDPLTDPFELTEKDHDHFRQFLAETFPLLAKAPIVKTRLCMYCDTWDTDFWIDHHPDRPGLVVATGGSGHGFKFAPIMGSVIADVVEKQPNKYAYRFAWRKRGELRVEDARFDG